MKNIIYFGLLTLVLLTSCSSATPRNHPQMSTVTLPPDRTPVISSPVATKLTATLLPTDSAEQCLGIRQNMPTNLAGEIVLSGKNSLYQTALGLHETPPYILVPATGDRLTLYQESGDEVKDFAVSPDKKWLTYYAQQSGTEGDVYVVGNDGALFKKYPAGKWWGVQAWLDNSHLLLSKFSNDNPYSSLVFNPFTSKMEQELLPKYPDIFKGSSGELSTWDKYQLPETVYSSDLSMVVYPKNPNVIVLWDIKGKKEIAEITDVSASSQAPLWLSNGKEFVIDITQKNSLDHWFQDELMIMGIDGQVRQLTHLVNHFEDVAIQPRYSESNDGQYIAFWFVQVGGSGPSRLAVYDTITKTTKAFCISVGGYVPPVWSPSGHQLLVDGTFDSLDNYGTIFIDVESNLLAQVETGVIPMGWMTTP